MSDALIASLQGEINRLNGEVAKLNRESKDRRIGLKGARAEADDLRTKLAAAEADRDGWKTKTEASPGQLQGELDAARAQLRARDHRDAWRDAVADPALGIDGRFTVEQLWALTGYKPEEMDTADPKAVRAFVEGRREAVPAIFAPKGGGAESPASPAPGGAQQPAPKAPLAAGLGADRGGPRTEGAGRLVVRKADLQDPAFALNHARRLAEAQAAGLLSVTD